MAGRDVTDSRRRCASCVVMVLAAAIAGCGKHAPPPIKGAKLPVFPVKGKLIMDGKPMIAAAIIFNPVQKFPKEAAKLLPRAIADENGDFTVSTYGDGDGAPAGDYKITISWKGAEAVEMTDGARGELEEKAPEGYQSPRMSRIRIKVKEEPNTLPTWDLAQLEGKVSSTP